VPGGARGVIGGKKAAELSGRLRRGWLIAIGVATVAAVAGVGGSAARTSAADGCAR